MRSYIFIFLITEIFLISVTNSIRLQHFGKYAQSNSQNSLKSNIFDALRTKVESIVVNSAVLSFAPWLELHHIVLLKDKSNPGIVCVIDFSPLDQSNPNTISNLLLGKSVPAEIRVNWLDDFDGHLESVKDIAVNSSKLSSSLLKRYRTPPRNTDPVLVNFVKSILDSWSSEMNFYHHNCQHFSRYVQYRMNVT